VDVDAVIKLGIRKGANYIDVRYQDRFYELVTYDTGNLREYSISKSVGLGIRVLYNGFMGFASTNILTKEAIERAVKKAITCAKASSIAGHRRELIEAPIVKDKVKSMFKVNPIDVDPEVKVKLVKEVNKNSIKRDGIKSAITRIGCEVDRRIYASSEGTYIEVTTVLTGFSHTAIAKIGNVMERVHDSKSSVAGYEFIEGNDWLSFAEEVDELALKAVKAKTPPPGSYPVVLDNRIVGLLLHEAFGHATEADGVEAGASVLTGRIGEKVASELVTIVDEGIVEGGYFMPYDDEGVPKKKTIVVENGILKTYLHSRYTAKTLGGKPTGNARAQDCFVPPLVRQTNFYLMPRGYKNDELFEDIDFGIYVKGRGAMGGEVNTSVGTFTFNIGPSYIIRKGEISELVRGVIISGMILETLKEVDAVAKDLTITTSVFGGCGKGGQRVRVGDGGPHIRVRKMIIGGR